MSDLIIKTKQGSLKGKIGKDYKGANYYSFQGIPYAKPPIGPLRFKAPEEPEKWEGIRDATKLGNASLSRDFIVREKIIGAEDCLYLNVYTPQLPKNDKNFIPKPVMFWIHGGGFLYGSSNTDIYGPEYLVSNDIILVTINYRLGLLGFLSLEDSSLGVTGNMGLKDMVQALKWVQENIGNFGGDPKNVTIFGESAGGAACHLLILSPMAKGLFHKAILQSGCALNPWLYGSRIAKKVAEVLGFKNDDDKKVLEFLKTVPAEDFMRAQDIIKDYLDCNTLRPTSFVIERPSSSEPNFITQHPIDIIKSGNYNKVPMMVGYTNREGIIAELDHVKKYGSLKIDEVKNFYTKLPWYYNIRNGSELEKNISDQFKKFYLGGSELSNENVDQYLKWETDTLFLRGIYVALREHLKNSDQIYFYTFTLETNMNLIKKLLNITKPGVSHCDDLGYLFKTKFLPEFTPESREENAVEKITELWTNFAKKSNPISTKSEKIKNLVWTPVEHDTYNCLEIGDNFEMKPNCDLDRMHFWDTISSNPMIKSNL